MTENAPPGVATYPVPVAAKILGIGRDAAYEAVREGKIPALRFGRSIRVPCAALHRMLENAAAPTNQREES